MKSNISSVSNKSSKSQGYKYKKVKNKKSRLTFGKPRNKRQKTKSVASESSFIMDAEEQQMYDDMPSNLEEDI